MGSRTDVSCVRTARALGHVPPKSDELIRFYTLPSWHLRTQYQTCYNLPLSRAKLWAVSQLCCGTLHPSPDPDALCHHTTRCR